MKSKDVAKNFGLDGAAFESWLKTSGVRCKSSMIGGLDIDESQDITEIVSRFRTDHAAAQQSARAAEEQRRAAAAAAAAHQAEEARAKQQALASMLITSGFNFDGYTITKYSGYISGDDAVSVPRNKGIFFQTATNVGESLLNSLVQIRRNALIELKEAAYALGCNAVIGVDFDYLTLDPEHGNGQGGTTYQPYVFGVTANGNAVIIEKNAPASIGAPAAIASGQPEPPEPSPAVAPLDPGWHPDPTGQHRLRWWDGSVWTDNTHD